MSAIDYVIPKPLRGAPEPVKYVIAGIEAYGAYRLGKWAWHKFNPPPGSKAVDYAATEAGEILKNNTKLPPEQQIRASYTPSQMQTYADSLYTAMDGGGTTEEDIDAVFGAMKNDLDILLLIDAFGMRAGSSWFASSTPSNLQDWLQSDGMTARVNKILATKAKISKRF